MERAAECCFIFCRYLADDLRNEKNRKGLSGWMQRMIDTVSKMDMSAHPQVTELIEWRKAYDEL